MNNLEAGIARRYKSYFILEESSLRKMQAILEKAAKEITEPHSVMFRVYRNDSRFYETCEIEELLNDPNITGREINEILIALVSENTSADNPQEKFHDKFNASVVIIFRATSRTEISDRENLVYFSISYKDKNWALLLADEIEPQIIRTFKIKSLPKWTFLLFVIPFILFGIEVFKWADFDSETSTINYRRLIIDVLLLLIFPIFIAFIATKVFGKPNWYLSFKGEESVFFWGDQVHYFNERQKLRNNIFWGILVAFVVSVLASAFWSLYQR
ncbi:MAG TPA: hypothetical protein VF644_14235 [Pyrinomonadaceae bacterium]|jgi:hypothetical protein